MFDSSAWIDFTRTLSPLALKQFIAPFVLDPAAPLAEPVGFAGYFQAVASVRGLRLQLLQRPGWQPL